MKLSQLRIGLAAVAAMGLVSACQPIMPVYEARVITAWAGGGQDTAVIEAFLPERLDIRAGDTVTWKMGGEEIHSTTLLSGAPSPEVGVPVPGSGETEFMFNPVWASPSRERDAPVEVYDGTTLLTSGLMSRHIGSAESPPIEEFSATFSTPGVFKVNCMLHPWMTGWVVVHPNTDANVPSLEDIDAQIEAEESRHLADIAAAVEVGNATIQSDLAEDGTTLWHVRVGGFNAGTSNEKGASYDFMPKELTVKAGDTVIWASAAFHTITFDNAPPPPEPESVQEVEGDWPRILLNTSEEFLPTKPSTIYDPSQYYHSGDRGAFGFEGHSWALTFAEPGTYEYFCAYHRYLGMTGTIIVE
jgi:plastocyanin